ncbi:MAG: hypothetical protein HZB51_04790 [Chloroflexi bacterium]|nr:hypothetical protein [Chloroflexota bacterium]
MEITVPIIFKIGVGLPVIIACASITILFFNHGITLGTFLVTFLIDALIVLAGVSTTAMPLRAYKKYRFLYEELREKTILLESTR